MSGINIVVIVAIVLCPRSVLALHGGRVIWIVENEEQAAAFFVFVLGGAAYNKDVIHMVHDCARNHHQD